MKTKVGFATYQSIAIFKGWRCPSYNVNFIKGTLHNFATKFQHIKSWAMEYCQDSSRYHPVSCGHWLLQHIPRTWECLHNFLLKIQSIILNYAEPTYYDFIQKLQWHAYSLMVGISHGHECIPHEESSRQYTYHCSALHSLIGFLCPFN